MELFLLLVSQTLASRQERETAPMVAAGFTITAWSPRVCRSLLVTITTPSAGTRSLCLIGLLLKTETCALITCSDMRSMVIGFVVATLSPWPPWAPSWQGRQHCSRCLRVLSLTASSSKKTSPRVSLCAATRWPLTGQIWHLVQVLATSGLSCLITRCRGKNCRFLSQAKVTQPLLHTLQPSIVRARQSPKVAVSCRLSDTRS